MASLNRVLIMGNLGADPELRYTATGQPVANLRVATTRSYTGRDGEPAETTEWHQVVVWGKTAENCKQFLQKGRAVLVEGRLTTRSWEDKAGEKRQATEIVANSVQFLGSGRPHGEAHAPAVSIADAALAAATLAKARPPMSAEIPF